MIGLVWYVAGRQFAPVSHVSTQSLKDALPLPAMVAHTAQAICEALILNNLGLDATTTAAQALVFCAMLAALWSWSRRRPGPADPRRWPRPNPLEASGAALVIVTLGLIFSARGTESEFDSLRGLGWYDAMAELGAVLFVCGWCAGTLPSPPPAAPAPPGRREWLGVVLFAGVMLALQAPRADRVIFEYDEMAAPTAPASPGPVALRTPGDLATQARAQREKLAPRDRLEPAAPRGESSPADISRAVAGANVPGMPTASARLRPRGPARHPRSFERHS